jgi:hypothetical protein
VNQEVRLRVKVSRHLQAVVLSKWAHCWIAPTAGGFFFLYLGGWADGRLENC